MAEQNTHTVKPKAVVILFGWLGATMKHLSKYAQIYEDMDCHTICRIAPVEYLMLDDSKGLSEMALEALQEAYDFIQTTEEKQTGDTTKMPVFIHSFSNGGCFLLEQIILSIKNKKSSAQESDESVNHRVLELIQARVQMGALLFDSSPAYVDMRTAMSAIHSGVPNVFLRVALQSIVSSGMIISGYIAWLRGQTTRAIRFWEIMSIGTESCFKCEQVYIYSTSDEITNHEKLTELIEEKKKRDVVPVVVKKFTDSPHVQHFRTHKDEYIEVIKNTIFRAL